MDTLVGWGRQPAFKSQASIVLTGWRTGKQTPLTLSLSVTTTLKAIIMSKIALTVLKLVKYRRSLKRKMPSTLWQLWSLDLNGKRKKWRTAGHRAGSSWHHVVVNSTHRWHDSKRAHSPQCVAPHWLEGITHSRESRLGELLNWFFALRFHQSSSWHERAHQINSSSHTPVSSSHFEDSEASLKQNTNYSADWNWFYQLCNCTFIKFIHS